MSKRDLDWNSKDAESLVLGQFDDVCWAAKQKEVQLLVAFGSILDDQPWKEASATKLSDGKPLQESLKTLWETLI